MSLSCKFILLLDESTPALDVRQIEGCSFTCKSWLISVLMHGKLMEVISRGPQFFSVSLSQIRRWTSCGILLFNFCMNTCGFVWGGQVSYFTMNVFCCAKTWWTMLKVVEGPCSQWCHRPGWLGACGLCFRDTASRCQLAWLCFMGSLVTAPFDGLISRTSMYQTGCCDYSNAAQPGRSYRSHFLRLTVFYLGGLASTAREDWSTSFWPNLQELLQPCDRSVFRVSASRVGS